jgi:hypothetical protein
VPADLTDVTAIAAGLFYRSLALRFRSPLSPIPWLRAQLSGVNLLLSWPTASLNYRLETTPSVADPNSWTTVSSLPVVVESENRITTPLLPGHHFYRLRKP